MKIWFKVLTTVTSLHLPKSIIINQLQKEKKSFIFNTIRDTAHPTSSTFTFY
jgi:hypothetical protein